VSAAPLRGLDFRDHHIRKARHWSTVLRPFPGCHSVFDQIDSASSTQQRNGEREMKTKTHMSAVAGPIIIALALLLAAMPARAADESWDAIVAAAKNEGALIIKGGPGAIYA
jgi:hypothetical protein